MQGISELKKNVDFISVVEAAGVELKQCGTRHIGLCPFHDEKTPSFYIFHDNRFKCFGCAEYGDVIDFVQKLYGLSFLDALKHLGIEQGRVTPEMNRNIEKQKRRAKLIKDFRNWEMDYCTNVSDLYHKTKRLMMMGIPPEDLDLYAALFHMLPVWKYHMDILIHGTDEEKFKLFKEAHNHGEFCFSE